MKKIFLAITILCLCGCSAKYTLSVNGNQVTEEIFIPVEKDKIYVEEDNLEMGTYSKDNIEHLLNSDIYVEDGKKSYVYEKNVKDENGFYNVTLTHIYERDRLKNSRVLNECFENTFIEETKNGLKIKLSGKFYCYDSEENSLDFVISTKNVVKSASVNHNMFTNEYVWKIDKSNRDNVNIEMNILYESKVSHYGVTIAAIIIGIIFVIGAGFIIYKLVQRSKINEI